MTNLNVTVLGGGSWGTTVASLVARNAPITLWARNLFDKDYGTRGFFFGNNPEKGYVQESYTQRGEPRTMGLSVAWDY